MQSTPSSRLGALSICATLALAATSLPAQSPFLKLGEYEMRRALPNYAVFAGRMLANVRASSADDVLVSDGSVAGTRHTQLGSAASAGVRVVGGRAVLFESAASGLAATVVDASLRVERTAQLGSRAILGPSVGDGVYVMTTPNPSRTLLYRFTPSDGAFRYLFHRTPRGGGGWASSFGRLPTSTRFVLTMTEVVQFVRRSYLYVSDGTDAGTFPLDEQRAAAGARLVVPDAIGSYYVEGDEAIRWTDGTRIRTLAELSSVGYIFEFVVGSRFWFSARRTSTSNTELYVLEGTGARRVSTLSSGPTHVQNLTPVGDLLYFSASARSGATGTDLWVSDGTEAGTRPVDSRPQAQRDARNLRTMESPSGKGFALVRDQLLFFTGTTSSNSGLFAYRPPHAFASKIGASCSLDRVVPELSATTPTLGQELSLTSSGHAASTLHVLAIGAPLHVGAQLPGGCLLHVDPSLPLVIADAWASGSSRTTRLAVPNEASLDGTSLHAQVLRFADQASPEIATSNAVHLRLGR